MENSGISIHCFIYISNFCQIIGDGNLLKGIWSVSTKPKN